jgi:hypothetical protein
MMIIANDPVFPDPSRWVDLRFLLQKARSELGSNGILPPPMTRSIIRAATPDRRREMLESAYRPLEGALSQAIQCRFDRGAWPEMGPQLSHYASIVLHYSYLFVIQICPRTESGDFRTICPFPAYSVGDVAVYLCTDWWKTIGWQSYDRDFYQRREPVA